MARLNRHGFLAIALVFHIIYAYSIFDIYFVSPIVSGMREHGVRRADTQEAPAQRLVLFVGDGLRADKAFEYFPDPSPEEGTSAEDAAKLRPMAPFIRSRVLEHGTFGISHTRVPTESRPGHVALIAGLYEDVSAVMTGWKLNPVNFDSVFNRSRHTWSWGSPDILPMFQLGAVPGRVDAECYSAHDEDFTVDATWLDTWVFDNVKDLFESAKTNSTLDAMLREDKLVFFLHLLGIDTTGHGSKPHSKEYLHNIKVVDKGVEEITKLVDEFYDDGKTAYVFTADHGMSDTGSHGDGHPDNTRTPLVVWGSGVAPPILSKQGVAPGHADGISKNWHFDHVQRHDVEQADVAALMAYLVGLEFPVNSVGELPLDYLSGDIAEKAEGMFANVKEVMEMYLVKQAHKASTRLRFVPFQQLGQASDVSARLHQIQLLLDSKKYTAAIDQSKELMLVTLQGLRYLQTYDWLFLRTIVTLGYLGWIAYALTVAINQHVLVEPKPAQRGLASSVFFGGILASVFATLHAEQAPWRYYAYAFFPVVFWEEVITRRASWSAGRAALLRGKTMSPVSIVLNTTVYIGLLQALYWGYFYREVFTGCFILAAFWPMLYGRDFLQKNIQLAIVWAIACVTMSSFTLLPAVKTESTTLITVGGLQMIMLGVGYLLYNDIWRTSSKPLDVYTKTVFSIQIGLIGLAILVTRSTIEYTQAKVALPLGNRTVGWSVFVLSLLSLALHRGEASPIQRLMALFLTFAPSFVLLSISFEGIFYFTFTVLLYLWILLEARVSPTTSSRVTLTSLRHALFVLVLIQSAFFSTGNVASVSTFSLDSVKRLVPVFDPFSQGALLILQIMIPFALVSFSIGLLNRLLHLPPTALFTLVTAIGEVLTLNFFWSVKDEGSWLEIGSTISHFVIASTLGIFVALLEAASLWFLSGVVVEERIASEEMDAGVKPVENGHTKTE